MACAWLSLKVMIELIMNHIIKGDGRESPLSIYKGVFLAITMMFLINPLFNFGYQISNSLTSAVITVSGLSNNGSANEGTISKSIITSMVYDDQMDEKDKEYLIQNWQTVDITKKEGGVAGIGDVYTYNVNFFMLVVLSVLTVFLLFFIAIQISKRVMEIALYKIIAPFCCTGLTNNNSKSFNVWLKSTMGEFLITVVQFVSLGLMLNLFGTAIKDNGTIAGIFLIIGSLLFIITSPTLISSLLGQDVGLKTAFGDMQSLMAMGQGVNAGLKVASGGLASGVNVIPKTAGHLSGLSEQYSGYKNIGDSTMKSLGKTAFSEVTRPFGHIYSKAMNSFEKSYNKRATPFRFGSNERFNTNKQNFSSSNGGVS